MKLRLECMWQNQTHVSTWSRTCSRDYSTDQRPIKAYRMYLTTALLFACF
jgi:hypothetical protein